MALENQDRPGGTYNHGNYKKEYSLLDTRPCHSVERGDNRTDIKQQRWPCPKGRTIGLQPPVACRAPQHGACGQRGHLGADRAYSGPYQEHKSRIRRDHAAQPLAADRGRAVRDTRQAVSQPDRPGTGKGAGYRPGDGPCDTKRQDEGGAEFPRGGGADPEIFWGRQ